MKLSNNKSYMSKGSYNDVRGKVIVISNVARISQNRNKKLLTVACVTYWF